MAEGGGTRGGEGDEEGGEELVIGRGGLVVVRVEGAVVCRCGGRVGGEGSLVRDPSSFEVLLGPGAVGEDEVVARVDEWKEGVGPGGERKGAGHPAADKGVSSMVAAMDELLHSWALSLSPR